MTVVRRALLALVLLSPLLPQAAAARSSHTKILKCNVDGTYTCGGTCTELRYCCQIGDI
jgi:hypothetical protein